ncbi:hypothetical protein KW782_04010 [Candidatus Parcubacteria bacterium]|nr:hypothetical protein [Candidatus Parcubacteria bacterium]
MPGGRAKRVPEQSNLTVEEYLKLLAAMKGDSVELSIVVSRQMLIDLIDCTQLMPERLARMAGGAIVDLIEVHSEGPDMNLRVFKGDTFLRHFKMPRGSMHKPFKAPLKRPPT